MSAPDLTVDQVRELIPTASEIEFLDRGGQKTVFKASIGGIKYAVKFMRPSFADPAVSSSENLDDVTARAQREVETMQQCTTPHLVKMGPIGLRSANVGGEGLVFFTEEFVDGKNLRKLLAEEGTLAVEDLMRLAFEISQAIAELWQFNKIHRDIKPGNIMRRSDTGAFVLLDMGLVLDLQDSSISLGPVGTTIYFSPEQRDFQRRRSVMSFRSDLFSLGIVLYEMATGKHPFVTETSLTSFDVLGNIANLIPPPPNSLRLEIPERLNEAIMRLLAKRPALRYRTIRMFHEALGLALSKGDNS
jgi:serine/threonine-protein kinase